MEDKYKRFADYYDEQLEDKLTLNMYNEWKKVSEEAIKKYDVAVKTLADLGCGTGITTIPWLKKGYRVLGVEISKSMLREAKKKSFKVRWINQDLVKLNLKEKVDVVTCHFDVLNHILRKKDLQKTFDAIFDALNVEGLFIFDMISEESIEWHRLRKIQMVIREKAYSKEEVKEMLKKTGFKILKVKKQKTPEWDGKPRRLIYLVRR